MGYNEGAGSLGNCFEAMFALTITGMPGLRMAMGSSSKLPVCLLLACAEPV